MDEVNKPHNDFQSLQRLMQLSFKRLHKSINYNKYFYEESIKALEELIDDDVIGKNV